MEVPMLGVCQYCGKPSVCEGALCADHWEAARTARRDEAAARLTALRAEFRYYLPAGDLGVDFRDAGPWRSYDVDEVRAHTARDLLAEVSISEVDQDGGDLACYGFEDAPREVQDAILKAVGLTREEI